MNENTPKIVIRECESLADLNACVSLQREVFELPDLEISPVRHLIVTQHAGGFSLGAFVDEKLVGFLLSVPGFNNRERFFYSHMTAVSKDFQNFGIGAKLKWAQRERALSEGVAFIKWTFSPVQARNAHFNLNRLGAIVKTYKPNFYGTDYANSDIAQGIDSDRLFAEWNLDSEKVSVLANAQTFTESDDIACQIEIPSNWNQLVKEDPKEADAIQNRVKSEFQRAFAAGLICKSFRRDEEKPTYLFYKQ